MSDQPSEWAQLRTEEILDNTCTCGQCSLCVGTTRGTALALDAARLEGVRRGLEAASNLCAYRGHVEAMDCASEISSLNAEEIAAKETG